MSLTGASRTLAGLLLVQVGRRAGVMVCYAAEAAGRAAVLECGGGRECRHRKGSGGVMRVMRRAAQTGEVFATDAAADAMLLVAASQEKEQSNAPEGAGGKKTKGPPRRRVS